MRLRIDALTVGRNEKFCSVEQTIAGREFATASLAGEDDANDPPAPRASNGIKHATRRIERTVMTSSLASQ
jgi:hypothetical protein